MAGPAKLVFQECGFDAGDLGLFEDLDVGDKVSPVDVEDGAETTLMKLLEESDVAPVGHPCLGAAEKGGGNYGTIYKDLSFILQVLIISHPLVQSTKGTVCSSKPVVHFFIYPDV